MKIESNMEVEVLRVEANNAYASVMYQGYAANKRVPNFAPQDSLYQESLKDESKQLKNVYHDFSQFNPMNFLGTAYIRSKIMESSQSQENSINLTPGTTLSLGEYSGQDVILSIGDSSVSMSWGSNPIGSAYVKKFNETINRMLNGQRDENGIPDLSKLTREQVAELRKIARDHEWTIMQMGGVEQYESIWRIGESFDYLIRIANGQMPMASLSPDMYEKIKAGLDKMGIDTSKPFYVNGQKFTFTEGGALRYSE